MTAKDMVMMGLFVLAVVGFTAGFWAGFSRKFTDMVKTFKDRTDRLRAENERLKIIACRSRGKCRRTPDDDLQDLRIHIGREAYQEALYASKPDQTLCEECASKPCPDRDDRETCVGFIETPDLSPVNSVTGKSINQQVADSNVEAAEPENHARFESTKAALAESIKHMPGVVVDGLSELTSWLGGILGEEHVGNLKDSGFTNEEIADIKWGPYGGALYGIHPNHLPMRIDENGIEFSNVFEGLPADFWEKVQGIGMTDEARKILEEGDGGEG